MAEKTNSGVAVSAISGTDMDGCLLKSIPVCFPSCLLFFCQFQHSILPSFDLSLKHILPFFAVRCCILPGLCVNVQRFHIALIDVLVMELRAPKGSFARSKFPIHDVFRHASIFHVAHMAASRQPALVEQRVDGGKASASKYLCLTFCPSS